MKHWFIQVNSRTVEGMCSDGRTFVEPSDNPDIWVKGFITCLNMFGQSYEIRVSSR